jgi:hypothetical protein
MPGFFAGSVITGPASLFQPGKNTIDRKSVFWYSKSGEESGVGFFYRPIPICGYYRCCESIGHLFFDT